MDTPVIIDNINSEGAALPEDQPPVAVPIAAAPAEGQVEAGEDPSLVVNTDVVPAQGTASVITEADCLCWPHSRESLGPPEPLEELLPEVWQGVGEAIKVLNHAIEHLRARRLASSPETLLSTAVSLSVHGAGISVALTRARDDVSQTPGYIFPKPQCKNSFERHLAFLTRRDATLRTIEENIKQTMADAQPLFDAREKFLAVQRKMERQRARHMVVRTAAVLTLPFNPILSAALTAVDTLLSVVVGVEQIVVSEDELRSTSASVDSLRKEVDEKIAVVQALRHELVAIRAKAEAQRDDPVASRLFDILRKMQNAKELAEAVFRSPNSKEAQEARGTTPSVRELAAAMRKLVDALGEQPEDTEKLVAIDDSEWGGLDETVAELKGAILVAGGR